MSVFYDVIEVNHYIQCFTVTYSASFILLTLLTPVPYGYHITVPSLTLNAILLKPFL